MRRARPFGNGPMGLRLLGIVPVRDRRHRHDPGGMQMADDEHQPTSPFETYSNADVAALIAGHPLAWVSSRASGGANASLLPIIARHDDAGALTALVGHFGRANPLHADFLADPRATFLFTGPQGYVSPDQAGLSDWGPTWNYAQLIVEARLVPDAAMTDESLDVLVAAMERDSGWAIDALGARAAGMKRAIIGFRAEPVAVRGRFKLGQDEDVATLRTILARHPDAALVAWMRRMNAARLG